MLHKGDEKPVIRHDNSGTNGDHFTYEVDVSARANNPVQSGMPIFRTVVGRQSFCILA